MILYEVNKKENLGEIFGAKVKNKFNSIVYWIVVKVFVGGISGIFSFIKGFLKGWNSTKFKNI